MLLHDVVALAAAARPDAPAVRTDAGSVTFFELDRRIHALADRVRERTRPGDRVLVHAANHLDVVTALYALPLAGTVATFANTRHVPAEVAALVATTRPALALVDPPRVETTRDVLGGEVPCWTVGGSHPGASASVVDLLDDTAARDPGAGRPAAPDRTARSDPAGAHDDAAPAWLIHTSGTTGRPKGVLLSHRNLLAAVLNTAIARPLRDDDVYLFPFPLFHVAAYNVVHAHLRRCPVVLMEGFDAAGMVELVASAGVTACSLAPTMLTMLLDHCDDPARQLRGLRQIAYGAAPMPLELIRRVTAELPEVGLAQGYGMTELAGNAVFLGPEEHRAALGGRSDLLGAAGRPGPLVAVRIVGEDGAPTAPGGVGDIEVRGEQVCLGYFEDPEATAEAIVDGWLRTGDVGRFDADGVLHVVDRRKDLVITGGENVASREVEDVLGAHDDVAMVAVVGAPDPRWGERVVAVVVPRHGRLDPDELMAWTRGRLAGFKRPRQVVVVDELPLNASGKVDKVRLRAQVSSAGRTSGTS